MTVHGRVRVGIGETEVRRRIDDHDFDPGADASGQQLVDEAGRSAVRGGREHEPLRCRAEALDRGVERHERLVRKRGREMVERFRHGLAGLTRRHDATEREPWVRMQEAQELAGHVAGAAEHDGGNGVRRAHALFR